jgi:hypothetical protein
MDYNVVNISTLTSTSYSRAIISLEGNNIVVYEDQENGAILGVFPTASFYCTYQAPK